MVTGETSRAVPVEQLYKARRGAVDIVSVPELQFVTVQGQGAPEGQEFADAVQALYSVSYGARFLVKKQHGLAQKVMPLEALWWVDDPEQQRLVVGGESGATDMSASNRDLWCWKVMIRQPEPIDGEVLAAAVEGARKKSLPALERVAVERWEEGLCGQVLHVGPYADEGPTILQLHEGIASAGYTLTGRHHEIYVGDPRRSAPDKLRTILRQPCTGTVTS
jgi:hypothetical protein